MPRPSEARPAPAAPRPRVRRFTPAEHRVHRATATLMAVCVLTAGCLYLPFLAELVGRRALVVTLHEWSGLLLPVPLLLGLGSRALRADLTRLNRYGPHDRQWLRAALRRRGGRPAGKFNAGQKLYAAWIAGAVLVMLGTGLLMWFPHLAPLLWRTGATFVHDWLALAVVLVISGHVWRAYGDPESRRGLRTGTVDARWARREHPLWVPEEAEGRAGEPGEDGRGDGGHTGDRGPRPAV
ncbi:cytochrome b/b6 domain-containing protein [Streptomyces angustmyceticus]|uniref:Formate dehydrogenase subunit gamma n=2 Tax=Streptomyces angustmyceticus TaxID=285578 RepID=A0A5J4LRW4_9ACTN|nr:cytochrome b/b6 domain-containing protein [Streptomyces angustmyceticus]GES33165.1 formate dehydrogenase subunit gamma [Streptomyces angustmyceticus]